MAIQKTAAIVLRTQPLRSTSLLVTFFTPSFGKIKGVAKGVRQEREMRGALFELFTQLEIIFYEKTRSDLHLVSEASIVEAYPALHARLDTIAYASLCAELADELTVVHDPHEKIFGLLDSTFRFLPSIPAWRLLGFFEIKLLSEIGWLPYLEACLSCRQTALEKGFFSASQGALLCPRCAPRFPDAHPMSREVLACMRYYSQHSFEESLKYPLSAHFERELEALLSRFILERLGKPLKSQLFLEKIKPALKND